MLDNLSGNPGYSSRQTLLVLAIGLLIPMACLTAHWFQPSVTFPLVLKSALIQVCVPLLLVFYLAMRTGNASPPISISNSKLVLLALFVLGTLSVIWSANVGFWVYKWSMWYVFFATFFMVLGLGRSEKHKSILLVCVLAGGVLAALIGIAQYLFGFDLVLQAAIPASTFANKNMAAQVMVLALPVPCYFLFKEKMSGAGTWLSALSLCLIATYIYYTRTRAVWIASSLEVILLAILVMLDRRRIHQWLFWNKSKSIAVGVSGVIFLVLINVDADGLSPFWKVSVTTFSSVFEDVVNIQGAERSERYTIWQGALMMIRENPLLGSGLGSFFDNLNQGGDFNYRLRTVQRAHNDILETGVELGLTGVLLILSALALLVRLIARMIRHAEGPDKMLYMLIVTALTGSAVNAQFSFPLQLQLPLFVISIYLALLVTGVESMEAVRVTIPFRRWQMILFTGSGLLIAILLVMNNYFWLKDLYSLNNKVENNILDDEWKPRSRFYSQAHITTARNSVVALKGNGQFQLAGQILDPILEYWPHSLGNIVLAAEINLAQGQTILTEYWAREALKYQPADAFMGEYFLMNMYTQREDTARAREIYNGMRDLPEASLSRYPTTYEMLHSFSINFQDFEKTTLFYQKYREYYGQKAAVEANQAIYYVNTGNLQAAVPQIRRALELNPNTPLAGIFNQILDQVNGQ